MSEPTYRVDLTHNPADGSNVCWTARVFRPSQQDEHVHVTWGSSREEAFDLAQLWIKANTIAPQPPSTVYLTEDGDILPPHELHSVKS